MGNQKERKDAKEDKRSQWNVGELVFFDRTNPTSSGLPSSSHKIKPALPQLEQRRFLAPSSFARFAF
jgi:hypothetical protein